MNKLTKFLKNKNTVTALCVLLAAAVILIGYNIRVKNATNPVRIPVAAKTIQPKQEITDDMISYVNVPRDSLHGNFISNKASLIGKYTQVNTVIPEGSLFYKEAVTDKNNLPDSALYDVQEGETLFYLTVNMLSSYTNSILPGNYIDIYVSTKEGSTALVGKLFENIKILGVKTSDGKNVFENSDESRTPYVLIFAVPEEQHLLLRAVNAINNYNVFNSGDVAGSRIELIPVPVTSGLKAEDGTTIKSNVTSKYLKEYIEKRSVIIEEDIPEIDMGLIDKEDNKEDNNKE